MAGGLFSPFIKQALLFENEVLMSSRKKGLSRRDFIKSTTAGHCWALSGWEDWSAFKDVNISTDRGSQKIPRDWKDTWKFAAGVHYRPVEKWLLQVGFSYDTSPVDSDDRTPDMPMDRQIRYATGVQYKWSRSSLGRGRVRVR